MSQYPERYLPSHLQLQYQLLILQQFDNAQTKGLLTSILELGAFFGSLIAGPLADTYSRKVRSRRLRIAWG
jgi:MFS family permease